MQIFLHTVAFWMFFGGLKWAFPAGGPDIGELAIYNASVVLGLAIGMRRDDWRGIGPLTFDPLESLRVGVRQMMAAGVAVLFFLMLVGGEGISRLTLLSYFVLVFVTGYAGTQVLPLVLARLFFSERDQTRTLLVGSTRRVRRLYRWLRYTGPYGVSVAGLICDRPSMSSKACGFPILGETKDFERFLREKEIDQVILLEPPSDPAVASHLLSVVENVGARMLILDEPSDRFQRPMRRFRQLGKDFVCVRDEPLQSPVNRMLKRAVDIMVSLPVVLIVIPILAVIIRFVQLRYSPGPLFYRQWRSGTRRRPFNILKFRTMHMNGEAARQASKHDPRIYKGGDFLRRTSLDELPQFWNVLRGEMSIVGPRPHMLEHDVEFAKVMTSYHVRRFAKPGITGLAQVRGFRGEAKSDEDIYQRALCDIEYIERWSLLLDLKIIVQTAIQVVRPPATAY